MENKNQDHLGNIVLVAAAAIVGLPLSLLYLNHREHIDDWLVARYDQSGEPISCWQLPETYFREGDGSVSWEDPQTGDSIIIAGNYGVVRIEDGNWQRAAVSLRIDLERCLGGNYQTEE